MAANDNPYLALLQQEQKPPGWQEILQHVANLGFGLAGGLGQAASQGGSTIGGLGTGLILGNQMNAQAAQQAEKDRLRRAEFGIQAWKFGEEQKQHQAQTDAMNAWRAGFNVTPPQDPLMGPGGTAQPAQPGPDLKTGGAPLVDYLTTKHGLSPLAASTVVGNLYQESGFNPAATGDSGSAFGMGQWRLDRQTALRNFAATQNKPVTDPQVQLDYLVSEMKGGDMGAQRAYAGLQQAKTPQEANTAMMHFFRPAGYTPANPAGGHGFQNRVQNTQALLPNGQPAPQVAQGDAVTPGGSAIDRNAPAPSFMQPGGPNVVQAQYAPQPGQPPMVPGVVQPQAPVARPPQSPPMVPPPRPQDLPPAVKQTLATMPITTPAQAVAATQKALSDHHTLLQTNAIETWRQQVREHEHSRGRSEKQADEEIARREAAAVREENRKFEQKPMMDNQTGQVVNVPKTQWGDPRYTPLEASEEARKNAEEKRAAEKHEQEGDYVRTQPGGPEVFVPKRDQQPGMPRYPAPPAPPTPGTQAGDDHILSTVDRGSVEYQDAYNRQRSTPHVINGQAYVRDMTKVPPPTYGQPAGAPAPSAAPAAAPASKPSEVPGMTPVGEKNYTQEQGREHKFVSQIDNAIPKLLEQITDKDGNYTSKNLPSSVDIGLALNSYIPDAFVGNKARRYRQTVKDIVTATLRDTSGATIGKPEFTDDMQKYIPMAGDDADTIKQKVEALKVFSTAMAAGTGRPIDQYPTIKSFSEPITVDKSGKRL